MNTRARNISGQRFGKLTAIALIGKDTTGKSVWACQCDCGQSTQTTMLNLVSGNTKSCGCLRHISRRSDWTGHRFGQLIAEHPCDAKHWLCTCDCGNKTRVSTVHLTREHTKSCGKCRPLGSTSKHMKKRARNAANEWRRLTLTGQCLACGATNTLHAHHILPFAQYLPLRTDPENGACLCARCHSATHALVKTAGSHGDALGTVISERGPKMRRFWALLSGGKQDLKKAQHYLEKLIHHIEYVSGETNVGA